MAVVVKAALAGGLCGPPKPGRAGRVKRGKRAFPQRGKYARLLSRLRWHATETNDYPGLPRIAERHRVAGASKLLRKPNTREPGRPCPGADEARASRGAVVWPERARARASRGAVS